MLYETCFLARENIKWSKETEHGKTEQLDFAKLVFRTNDPAPPFNVNLSENYKSIAYLEPIMLNKDPSGEQHDLFVRYRAIFTLRELNTKESLLSICKTLLPENDDTCGALLKHEIGYVLAQMEDHNEHSVPFLLDSVLNDDEAPIARHEALIAIGEMVDE